MESDFVIDGFPSFLKDQEERTNDLRFIDGKLHQKVIITRYDNTLFVKVEEWREVEGQ